MPKKFPPITALDWSPLHNLKHLKRKEREKLEKEQRDKENSGRQQKFIYIEISQNVNSAGCDTALYIILEMLLDIKIFLIYYMDSIMFSVMRIDEPLRIQINMTRMLIYLCSMLRIQM